ncbi:MAG TPA: hypothetical protein VIE46_00265 [Gemmatimonadales bacterium]
MIKTAPLVAIAAVLAACGHAIATASLSESQLAPPDAFQCVMREFDVLGYQRTSFDKARLLTTARKVNPKITFSNVQFRKTWDRLEVQVQAGAKGTDLKVTPSTAAEYFGQTGPVLNQLETSTEAKEAATTLQQACSSSATAPPPSPQQ